MDSHGVGAIEPGIVDKATVSGECTSESLVGLQLRLHPHCSPSQYSSPAIENGITDYTNKLDPVWLPRSWLTVLVSTNVLNWLPVLLSGCSVICNLVANSHAVSLTVDSPGHGNGLLDKWLPGESAVHDHIPSFIESSHEE